MGDVVKIDPLIVDVYEGDFERRKMDWGELARAGAPWSGVILKATQGTYYDGGAWFVSQWPRVRAAGLANRRDPWVRGAYHYLDTRINGEKQADYFIATLKRAGGVEPSDLIMVDVERANQRGGVSGLEVRDCVYLFATQIAARLGKPCILYGNSWIYELGITSRMGCKHLAVARYTATLPATVYRRIGWDYPALWQYCGVDGSGHAISELPGYPSEAPGCGPVDISAVVIPGGVEALIA